MALKVRPLTFQTLSPCGVLPAQSAPVSTDSWFLCEQMDSSRVVVSYSRVQLATHLKLNTFERFIIVSCQYVCIKRKSHCFRSKHGKCRFKKKKEKKSCDILVSSHCGSCLCQLNSGKCSF